MKNIRLQTRKKISQKINQSINQSIKNITNIYFHKDISIILLYLFYISTHLYSYYCITCKLHYIIFCIHLIFSYIITSVWYTVHSFSGTFAYDVSKNINIYFILFLIILSFKLHLI